MTKPQRTLEDLKLQATPGDLRAAVRQAEFLRLPIDATAVIPDLTASPLELEFLRLCRRHRLPAPEANVRIGRYRVDFLWRNERLIVETDGFQAHHGRLAAAADRERDRYLTARGFAVVRFTYGQVMDAPREVTAVVRAELRRALDDFLPHVRQ